MIKSSSARRRIQSFIFFFDFRKKEIVVQTRQKLEDLEFQLMELEQAEEHFQAHRILVTQIMLFLNCLSFILVTSSRKWTHSVIFFSQ